VKTLTLEVFDTRVDVELEFLGHVGFHAAPVQQRLRK
jgi:hypothetical protein